MKKKSLFAVLAVLLAAVFAVGFAVVPVEADLEDDLRKAEQKLEESKKKQKEIEAKLKEAQADEKRQMEAKILLEKQLDAINEQLDAAEDFLAELKEDLELKNQQLIVLQTNYDAAYTIYRQRARINYEAGKQSLLEVLLTSGTLSELMTRIDLQTQIAEYDQSLMNKITRAIENQTQLTEDVHQEVERQKLVKAEIETLIKEQKNKIKDVEKAIQKLENNQERYQEQIDDLDERMTELDGQILALIKSIEEYKGGELVWPIDPNYTCNVTSKFTMREKYVNGKVVPGQYSFHAGIDIAAAGGTPVVAAADGKFTSVGWTDTGGGYQIQIDHGNNLSTISNHLKGFAKNPETGKTWKKGEAVKKGQLIGYVGTSGNSTGNHLDFRVVYRAATGVNRAKALGMKKDADYYVSGSVVYLNPLDFVTKQNKGMAPYSIQEFLEN